MVDQYTLPGCGGRYMCSPTGEEGEGGGKGGREEGGAGRETYTC